MSVDTRGGVGQSIDDVRKERDELQRRIMNPKPIAILLHCPMCNVRHIDEGEFATKPHSTHACQSCGHCWRPAIVDTVGVQFLPGFKNEKGTP